MAAQNDKSQYYSHLLVNKTKRAGLSFLIVVGLISVSLLLGVHIINERKDWLYLVLPIMIIGMPLSFYPMVEVWQYKPWQEKAQKYERHYRD